MTFGLRYHGMVRRDEAEPQALIDLLGELSRLELDLLVRDQSAGDAVLLLIALRHELEQILAEASRSRGEIRGLLGQLEETLDEAWPGAGTLEPLRRLSEERKTLAELDMALRPAQALLEEVVRRTSRRSLV